MEEINSVYPDLISTFRQRSDPYIDSNISMQSFTRLFVTDVGGETAIELHRFNSDQQSLLVSGVMQDEFFNRGTQLEIPNEVDVYSSTWAVLLPDSMAVVFSYNESLTYIVTGMKQGFNNDILEYLLTLAQEQQKKMGAISENAKRPIIPTATPTK